MLRFPLLFALAAVAAIALGQAKSGAQTIIEHQVASYAKAMHAKDKKGAGAMFLPTFVSTDDAGKTHTFKEIMAQIDGLFAQASSIKVTAKVTNFQLLKGEAHVTLKSVLDAEATIQGKLAKLHSESTSTQVWTPTNGTWKAKSAKQLSHTTSVDGKVVSSKG